MVLPVFYKKMYINIYDKIRKHTNSNHAYTHSKKQNFIIHTYKRSCIQYCILIKVLMVY